MGHKEHLVDRICNSLGISMADLARELNLTRSAVSEWKRTRTDIPLEHCKYLESRLMKSSSPITCADMRPNDWKRYWPELDQKQDSIEA